MHRCLERVPNPAMATFNESLTNVAKSAICSYLDGFAAFLRLPTSQTAGAVPLLVTEALRSSLARRLCNREVPPLAIPYSGGQCDTLYQVDVTATGTRFPSEGGGTETANFTNTWRGPIESVRLYSPDPRTGTPGFYILGRSSNPSPTWNGFFNLGFFSDLIFESVVIDNISIVRLDALPDNCGDPLPDSPPYNRNDYSFDTDITYDDDDGNTVVIPVGVAVGLAYIDADLNVNIPVDFTFSPNFDFSPDFNFKVDVNFNFGTGDFNVTYPYPDGDNPPRLPPPPPFDPDFPDNLPLPPEPPPGIPDPTEPDDDPIPVSVIVGCIVTTVNAAENPNIGILDQSGNPDVYYPDLGLVSFEISYGVRGNGWTEDIRVKNARQFIPCPWGGGAVRVTGTPRPGISWTITPVYGKPEERFLT